MADGDLYLGLQQQLSTQLFGKPIAVGNMTAEQRKVFQAEWGKVVQQLPAQFRGEYTERLNNEIKTQPLPGSRTSSAGSVMRAGAASQIGVRAQQDAAENTRALGNIQGEISLANDIDRNAIGSLTAGGEQRRLAQTDIASRVRSQGDAANASTAALWGGYAQGQGGLNARDQQTMADYRSSVNPLMTQLQARGSNPADIQRQVDSYGLAQNIAGGGLDYTASQYASNPADVQRQLASYNQLQGVGAGSLDYQAAQWQSNQADVARQLQGYNDLRGIGQGNLDWKSQAAQAYASPEDLENQKQALTDIRTDLKSGSAGQKEVRDKFKSLSDPEVTAKERFLSELARREFESADKSSRDAVSSNLAMRGLRSGGQQIAGQQAAQQQLSQDRLLKELGIQAQAVDRSMEALGGWGTAENSIRQGDQNALNMQAGLTTDMRNASFDEAYKRGIGADNASAANQATRLTGTVHSANQATNMRNASDAVGMFNTGETNVARANNQQTRLSGIQGAATQSNAIRSANDYVGTFNVGEQNTAKANNQATRMGGAQLQAVQSNAIRSANDGQRQFEDTYAAGERDRVGRLAGQTADIGLAQTRQEGGRQTDVFDRGVKAIDTGYGRQQDPNALDWEAADSGYEMNKDYFDAVTGAGDRRVGRAVTGGDAGVKIRQSNSDELARALGISTGQWALEEERQGVGL
jgi:hypothetical protein